MEIKIKSKNDEHRILLRKYEPHIRKMFLMSKKEFKVKLPDVLILRPLQQRKFKNWEAIGTAGYTPGKDLWIALNLKYYNGEIRDTICSWGNGVPTENIADDTAARELMGATKGKGYNDGYALTSPVGSFKPNELGLHDMSGNVSEWVADWFDENYYNKSTGNNPKGPQHGRCRVIRGGTWNPLVPHVKTTTRLCSIPGGRGTCMGFRIAHPK